MPAESDSTSERKSDHIRLSLTNEVSFKEKTNGFENYDFLHFALTEIDINQISFKSGLFGKKINLPFLISCMTGGTSEAENINLRLAEAAEELKIPIGMGSQRQALEDKNFHSTYKIIRRKASSVPVLGNIGAAQILKLEPDKILFLRDLVDADAMVIHFNPLQELVQKNGESLFKGIIKKIETLAKQLPVPLIAKEVGAGISAKAAEILLECGVKGIDVAGAGGTSWSGVEILRNKNNDDDFLWDWGLPTSYCIRKVHKLKKKYDFTLIGSGGINDAADMAKAFALGADLAASARIILMELNSNGTEGVVKLINDWFIKLKKIMYLTGSEDLARFQEDKIILKEKLI